ncbi:phospholipase D-like domain-containing protein [Streptomyces sp. NPDC050418]|uniref:phospholipase D-like domain-containing protein n=1 Tax=Streptomyces sp. NPDC050418 TaxID=3365612 RepID=UPI0037B1615A
MALARLKGTGRHRAVKPMRGGRQAAALATVLTAAGVQAVATGGTATAVDAPDEVPEWTEGPVFNNPKGTYEEQHAIRTRIIELVDAAVPGSSIKVAIYHLWEAPVTDALLAAKARGVDVQIVLDSTSKNARPTDPNYGRLAAALGTNPASSSFVTLCRTNESCLGNPAEPGTSIMHNKFWLFSEVEGATDVVVQSTSNMTPSAHTKFANDALLLPDNPTMYDAFSGYFRKMVQQDWESWRYRTVSNGLYKAYFFPRPGPSSTTDTMHSVLNNVTCKYTDPVTGKARATKVRVSIFKITRQRMADKLLDLKNKGCSVYVTYAESDSAATPSQKGKPGTWEKLQQIGESNVKCYNDDRNAANPSKPLTTPYIVHNKYILIDGMYDGAKNKKITFTGSQNMTDPSLRENDESIIKVDDVSVHDTYVRHFDGLRTIAYPGSADTSILCKGAKPLPEDGEPKQ